MAGLPTAALGYVSAKADGVCRGLSGAEAGRASASRGLASEISLMAGSTSPSSPIGLSRESGLAALAFTPCRGPMGRPL